MKLTIFSDDTQNAELTWLGRMGSITRLVAKPVRHLLDVRGGQCVHYHFTREGDRIQCINAASRRRGTSHGFLCPDHAPRIRAPYIPPYAWDDYSVEGAFIVEHDRKLIQAERGVQ